MSLLLSSFFSSFSFYIGKGVWGKTCSSFFSAFLSPLFSNCFLCVFRWIFEVAFSRFFASRGARMRTRAGRGVLLLSTKRIGLLKVKCCAWASFRILPNFHRLTFAVNRAAHLEIFSTDFDAHFLGRRCFFLRRKNEKRRGKNTLGNSR